MKSPISITARISLLFSASAAGVLVLMGALLGYAVHQKFIKEDTLELNGKIEVVRSILATHHKYEDQEEVSQRLKDIEYGHPGIIISVRKADGVLFSAGNPEVASRLAQDTGSSEIEPTIRKYGSHVYRYISSQIHQGGGNKMAKAVIALDITDDQNFLSEFQRYLTISVVLVSLLLGWLGWIVVHHGLSPVRQVSDLVAAISSKQLDKPLDDMGVPRELKGLVASFNVMRARLHESFRRLSDFSSDIAHELRTPIHNLLIQTQVTLAGDEDLPAYRSVLQSNEEEYQRLSRMISDMLFLAKADNKLLSMNKENVDLAREVSGLFEFYEAMASERGIHFDMKGEATVFADRLMIQRALSNLLSNALRFTPDNLTIRVMIHSEMDMVRISVSNPGPPIPVELQEKIFERLYRIDPSRREGHTDNVGLGLAITRSIIEMHGGGITAESKDGWVTFSINLPALAIGAS
jgi:two-component system heavy metal sensor histidine kinase CusS